MQKLEAEEKDKIIEKLIKEKDNIIEENQKLYKEIGDKGKGFSIV